MRAENGRRAAAAGRTSTDPFALLCPGRRLVLSLPNCSAAVPTHMGMNPDLNPSYPQVSPIPDAASTSGLPASSGVTSQVSAGASAPDASPGNPQVSPSLGAASTSRLPASNGVCGPCSAQRAEGPAATGLHPARAAGQSAVPGDPAPVGGAGATPAPAPASAAAGGAVCPGGGLPAGHLGAARVAGDECAASPARDADGDALGSGVGPGDAPDSGVEPGDAPGDGVGPQRLGEESGVSTSGTADAARVPRFTAAVLDVPREVAAAAARDCAVFIVPQVGCPGLCLSRSQQRMGAVHAPRADLIDAGVFLLRASVSVFTTLSQCLSSNCVPVAGAMMCGCLCIARVPVWSRPLGASPPTWSLHACMIALEGHSPRPAAQGREREWLFLEAEGQWEVARQCAAARLVLVALGRGHSFASLAAVQAELSPLVAPLTAAGGCAACV